MPELPEVETVVRALRPPVTGKSLLTAKFTLPRMLLGTTAKGLTRSLQGQTVREVGRRGKYAFLRFDRDALVFHLGMTGRLTWLPPDAVPTDRFARTLTGYEIPIGPHGVDRHTHAILEFEDGGRLLFRDPRTFGKIFAVVGGEFSAHPRFARMGPEPLECGFQTFLAAWPAGSSRPLKALLLDQTFLAGIGNIYADEALFLAGLHPSLPVREVPSEKLPVLHRAIRTVLKRGIENQGTTFSDYRKPDGTPGKNYERLRVYGRGGQPCRTCRSTLVKVVLAQRGTVFCPRCQGDSPPKTARSLKRTVDKFRGRRHT